MYPPYGTYTRCKPKNKQITFHNRHSMRYRRWVIEIFLHQLFPEQHIEQHSRQPKQPKAVHSWIVTSTKWLFSREQHWMQHMQQQCLHIVPQQFDAAFTRISAASGNFACSAPGGKFSTVAVKLPKPMQRFLSIICLWTLGSGIFLGACFQQSYS